MPSKRSWMWKHCRTSKDKKSVFCNICDASFEYSGSTSSLNEHFKAIHCIMSNENDARNHSEQQDHSETR
ncbi:unnamed protein product [Lasius platythorax]|uniref:BED-type domain-containing protein n=1 Tax=Lasius platythorax TaxID=488582 RepID=A0AAV2MXP0_9HYME